MEKEIVRVTKIFTIDMAHALFGYEGPCKNIHGHTYHLHVTVAGQVNTRAGDPTQGLVVDFGVIKEITHREVISIYDHALVLHKDAPYSSHNFLFCFRYRHNFYRSVDNSGLLKLWQLSESIMAFFPCQYRFYPHRIFYS